MTRLSDTHSHSHKRSKHISSLWRSEYISVNQLPASLFDRVESLVFRLELKREWSATMELYMTMSRDSVRRMMIPTIVYG